jgi:translation factor GUF1, mitochondrial
MKKQNLKAFLFDAKFVPNRGVQCLIKIMSGQLNVQFLRNMMSYHRQKRYDIFEVGIVQPNMLPTSMLTIGQVGYFLSNMKSVADAHIGDTFYEEKVSREDVDPFPGYEPPKSMVFAGIYPEDPDDYEELEKSL